MKLYVLLLTLLHSLGSSGVPLYTPEMEAMASRGIRASLAQVNSVYPNSHLYRVTRGSVSRVIPLGPDSVELLLKFGIKETVCVKTSTQDPQTCAFRPGFFVPSSSCFSRVQLSPTSQQVISLRCSRDESSSSESSEEMLSRGGYQFNTPFANRVLAPSAPPSAAQPGRSLQSQRADVWPRGDTFMNYLV